MTALSPPVDLTRRLIGFDTRNPGGNEADCADLLDQILTKAGFTVTRAAFEDNRPSIIARLRDGRRPALCFAGHSDTVPLGATPWRFDPFAGEIENHRIYGRGASDMKSGLAAMVTAACRAVPLLAEDDDLIVIIAAGEETGCKGSRYLAGRPELLGNAGALIVAEPTGNYPLVGHKGALWLTARFEGRTAHGAMPEQGDNAVYKAADAIRQLSHFDFDVAPHRYLGEPTLNVGYMRGGLNINSVPDAAEVGIDIRTMPHIDHADLMEKIRNAIGPEARIAKLVDVNALWTDPAHPWVRDVYTAVTPIIGQAPEPRTVAFFTDGAPLQTAYGDIPTVILGPGASAMAHQTDEYCPVEEIDSATSIYERLAMQWYGLADQTT